jgi:hypothetical protein
MRCKTRRDLLCNVAAFSIFVFPTTHAISTSASMSSFDWNNGNFPVKKNSKIVPAAHMSTAVRPRQRNSSRVHDRPTTALQATLEEYFRCTEPSCACTVRFRVRSGLHLVYA